MNRTRTFFTRAKERSCVFLLLVEKSRLSVIWVYMIKTKIHRGAFTYQRNRDSTINRISSWSDVKPLKTNINVKINMKIDWRRNQTWNATPLPVQWMNYMKVVKSVKEPVLCIERALWKDDRSTSLPLTRDLITDEFATPQLSWWQPVHLYWLTNWHGYTCASDQTFNRVLVRFRWKAKWFPKLTLYNKDRIKLVHPSCLYLPS